MSKLKAFYRWFLVDETMFFLMSCRDASGHWVTRLVEVER